MTGYHSGEMPKYQKHDMALWCINVSLCGSFIKVSLCCPFKQDVKFAMFLFMCQIAFFPPVSIWPFSQTWIKQLWTKIGLRIDQIKVKIFLNLGFSDKDYLVV